MTPTIFLIEWIIGLIIFLSIFWSLYFIIRAILAKKKTPPAPPAGTITGTTTYSGSKGLVYCRDCVHFSIANECSKKIEIEPPKKVWCQALGEFQIIKNWKFLTYNYREHNKKNNCEFWEPK